MIGGYLLNDEYAGRQKGLKRIRTKIAKKIGIEKLQKRFTRQITKYDNKDTDYYIRDFIGFGYINDIVNKKMYNEYIDVEFEDMIAMATKNYDELLRNEFGDYMQRPPEDQRICHSIEAYWRDK